MLGHVSASELQETDELKYLLYKTTRILTVLFTGIITNTFK